jgi:hypothetical protein
MTDPDSMGAPPPQGGVPPFFSYSSFNILVLFLAPIRLFAQGFRASIGAAAPLGPP